MGHDGTTASINRPRFGGAPTLPEDVVEQLMNRSRSEDGTYDERLAYLLSIISAWSYSDAATLKEKLAYYGMPDARIERISVVNEAMFVVAHAFLVRSHDGKLGVLAFRGTEPVNLINWLTDAEVVWRPLDNGRVHAGFFRNVEAVWRGILDHVVGAQREGMRDLYVTGHSLGGAMAVIAAKRLLDEGEPFIDLFRGVYTYGQPMIGDRDYADACNAKLAGRLFRHVYRRDVIARMPPQIVDRDFVHFGEARVCNHPKLTWDWGIPSSPSAPLFIVPTLMTTGFSFFARRLAPLRKLRLAYSIDDHVATNYVATCREALHK